jgi:hypothetical protein
MIHNDFVLEDKREEKEDKKDEKEEKEDEKEDRSVRKLPYGYFEGLELKKPAGYKNVNASSCVRSVVPDIKNDSIRDDKIDDKNGFISNLYNKIKKTIWG